MMALGALTLTLSLARERGICLVGVSKLFVETRRVLGAIVGWVALG